MTTPNAVPETPHPEAGFTLVEALVAIVVLAVGLLAVTNLWLVAISSNTIANRSTGAAAMASRRLDMLKTVPFNNLAAGTFTEDVALEGIGNLHTEWTITDVAGDAQLKQLRVVSTTGSFGKLAGVDFTSLRSCTDTTIDCPCQDGGTACWCGNGVCQASENNASCAADCPLVP